MRAQHQSTPPHQNKEATYFSRDACIRQRRGFLPYLGRSHLQRLVVVSEITFFSLPHRLHHQLGDRSHVQTCTNKFSVLSALRSVTSLRRYLNVLHLTGIGGELQAAGTDLRLGDGL